MSWARLLAVIFVISFLASAVSRKSSAASEAGCNWLCQDGCGLTLVSLLILDELDEAAHSLAVHRPALAHSALPHERKLQRPEGAYGRSLPSRRTKAEHEQAPVPFDEAAWFEGAFDHLHDDDATAEEDEVSVELENMPSLVFGGSGSNFDTISLWSTLWRGLGIDLASWNVDISNLTHSFEPSEQSKQRIASQQMWKNAMAASAADGQGATMTAAASEEAAVAALAAAQQLPSAPTPRKPRSHADGPASSVLHDLKPQQGIAPFVSLSPDCSQVRLALVHSYFERPTEPVVRDSRGDGLVEWFTRPAHAFIYPLQSVAATPVVAQPTALPADGESPFAWYLGLNPEALLAAFPESQHRSARRRLVDGDWMLLDWTRINGVVHAQATSNAAGGCGTHSESDWTVVAFEELDQEDPIDGVSQTKLQVFFQPTSDEATGDDHSHSRVSLVLPLKSLRIVTALNVVASSAHAEDASTHSRATIFYSIRGDKRVFRSVTVLADKVYGEWKLTWSHSSNGPPAQRRGFISQTVALQPYTGQSEGIALNGTGDYKVIASELNWAHGPVVLAGPLAAGSINKWTINRPKKPRGRSKKQPQQPVQATPPYSAGIYGPGSASDKQQPFGPEWEHESWITSAKTAGKYGPDIHPLSIHRGNEGSLSPLVTAASSDRRFVAFAQVPLITTIDSNRNPEPIEIVHLEPDTIFTGLAFNQRGTILAVADNHGDIILLQRSNKAANQQQATEPETATPEAAPIAETAIIPLDPSSSEVASLSEEVLTDAITSEPVLVIDDEVAVPTAPIAPPRKRHAWEVMMEIPFPQRVKRLPLISVQIVDVPVSPPLPKWPQHLEADSKEASGQEAPITPPPPAASDPATVETTPILVLLFQGGVLGTMQLRAVGAAPVPAKPAPSTLASHFHHQPLPTQLTLAVFESFLNVHWHLLLILVCGIGWLVASLPRLGRLAVQAQLLQQQQLQQQQQQQQQQGGVAAPQQRRGFFQLLLGGAQPQPNPAAAAAAAPLANAPLAQAPAVHLNPLNPLAALQRQQQQAQQPPQPQAPAASPSNAALPPQTPAVAAPLT